MWTEGRANRRQGAPKKDHEEQGMTEHPCTDGSLMISEHG
jgi:hypothetical protein